MFPVNQNFLSANAGLSNGNSVIFPMYLNSAPTSATIYAPYGIAHVGQHAVVPGVGEWVLLNIVCQAGVWTATWSQITDADGPVQSVVGTANQITATNVAGTVTLTTPSTFVAPGSIAATTTLTATLGNITATNGNFVSSTAGNGLSFNANTATGAAASPVVLNSRAGQVVFSSVSIAAAADLTLTITNSAITGASTQVIFSMSGATTGSALSVKSVTPGSGTIAFVVTNGTGATTTTADIKITFLVVN